MEVTDFLVLYFQVTNLKNLCRFDMDKILM